MKDNTEMLKGVIEGCVLEIISNGKTYGYEITAILRNLGFKDVVEGTIYTILTRCEKNKLVKVTKKPSQIGPPRKFYSLSALGQKELRMFWRKWRFISTKVNELRRHHE
jgi:DNA-binding PadR family transcriptional regulator